MTTILDLCVDERVQQVCAPVVYIHTHHISSTDSPVKCKIGLLESARTSVTLSDTYGPLLMPSRV